MAGGPKQPEDQTKEETSLVIATEDNPPTVVDDQVYELQEQLAEAKDHANELIFYFILVLVIVFNVFAFPFIGSTLGVLLTFILECLLLLPLSARLGVEQPSVYLNMLMRAIIERIGRGKD